MHQRASNRTVAERGSSRPSHGSWLVRVLAAIDKRSLDGRLLAGESEFESPELAERSARLVDPRHRRGLADSLRQVVERACAPPTLGRSTRVPLRRRDIQEHRALLLALARELADEATPRPRGVILAERLLTAGDSPLYAGDPDLAEDERPSVELAARHARAALSLG